MKQSILSAIIVLIAGYIGAFLPPAFCIIITIAVATGCIVYAIKQILKMKQSILSAIIVLIAGYIGAFLPPAFCIIITIAVATGCIVYAIKQKTL